MPENTIGFSTRWRLALVLLLVVLLAILGLYSQTAAGMVSIWERSETYTHGFVVPLITLWLVWRIRSDLLAQQPRPSPSAWLLLAVTASVWLVGDLVAVNVVTQFALVLLIILSVPAVLGWGVARRMAFPLGFLLFAVPAGDFLLPQFMEWTADFTVLALRWSGIPVYREGLQFIIPSGAWSVVEACSGIRYLIASLTVGCLFAYLSYRSIGKRLAFIGVAIVVPLVANWLRAYMIVMIGHLSGNELATGVDHLIYGWVFFGVVILVMLLIGARWADPPLARPAGQVPNVTRFSSTLFAATSRPMILAALAVLCILAAPHLLVKLLDLQGNHAPVQLVAPEAVAPWQTAEQPPIDFTPAFQNPSAMASWGYLGPQSAAVGLHVSYYRQQGYDRKLVSSENVLVTSSGSDWARLSTSSAQMSLPDQTLAVSQALLRKQRADLGGSPPRLLAWRFYWVNGRLTGSDIQAKIQGALSRLTGHGDDGAIVVVYTPLALDGQEADALNAAKARLQAFAHAQGPSLEVALMRASSAR